MVRPFPLRLRVAAAGLLALGPAAAASAQTGGPCEGCAPAYAPSRRPCPEARRDAAARDYEPRPTRFDEVPRGGVYSQPAAAGDYLGETTGIGIRGLSIRLPEIRLELPEIQLPCLFHVRRGAEMRTDSARAPYVTGHPATYGMIGAGGHAGVARVAAVSEAQSEAVYVRQPAPPHPAALVREPSAGETCVVRTPVRSACEESGYYPSRGRDGAAPAGEAAGVEPPPAPVPAGMRPEEEPFDRGVRTEDELSRLSREIEARRAAITLLRHRLAEERGRVRPVAAGFVELDVSESARHATAAAPSPQRMGESAGRRPPIPVLVPQEDGRDAPKGPLNRIRRLFGG